MLLLLLLIKADEVNIVDLAGGVAICDPCCYGEAHSYYKKSNKYEEEEDTTDNGSTSSVRIVA